MDEFEKWWEEKYHYYHTVMPNRKEHMKDCWQESAKQERKRILEQFMGWTRGSDG